MEEERQRREKKTQVKKPQKPKNTHQHRYTISGRKGTCGCQETPPPRSSKSALNYTDCLCPLTLIVFQLQLNSSSCEVSTLKTFKSLKSLKTFVTVVKILSMLQEKAKNYMMITDIVTIKCKEGV